MDLYKKKPEIRVGDRISSLTATKGRSNLTTTSSTTTGTSMDNHRSSNPTSLLSANTTCAITDADLLHLLSSKFDKKSFINNQLEIIKTTLARKDVLVLTKTGGGKSLMFQLPALIDNGITLVISPLLALIKSQVTTLKSKKIPAESLNSTTKVSDKKRIMFEISSKTPSVKLLYVTPELLATEKFRQILIHIHSLGNLSRLVIDEAHCISEWGHEFRNDYRKLKWFKERFPDLPILALTATATKLVQQDIQTLLGGTKWIIFCGDAKRFNLFYEVRYIQQEKVYDDILELLNAMYKENQCMIEAERSKELQVRQKTSFPEKNTPSFGVQERPKGICGIIYCRQRATCDLVAERLRTNGINARSFHAGLSSDARHQIATDWQNTFSSAPASSLSIKALLNGYTTSTTKQRHEAVDIIVATLSFGMGIDKKDVRFVLHYDTPSSLSAYAQESGRAGRDGQKSRCILYTSVADIRHVRWSGGEHSNAVCIILLLIMKQMIEYCVESKVCRHLLMARYFGMKEERCGNACDVCVDSEDVRKRRDTGLRYIFFKFVFKVSEKMIEELDDEKSSAVKENRDKDSRNFVKASDLLVKTAMKTSTLSKVVDDNDGHGFQKASSLLKGNQRPGTLKTELNDKKSGVNDVLKASLFS